MSETYKVKRAVLHLGNTPIEVFQLPSGQYQLSQTSSTAAVNKPSGSISDFQRSKSPYALPHKELTFQTVQVEGERANIKLVPIDYAIAYWTKEAVQGNQKAVLLLAAAAAESIERRADAAFCVERTESERNQRYEQVQSPLESQMVSSPWLNSMVPAPLQLQMQQMMLLLQQLQVQIATVQIPAQAQPQVTKQSTYIAIEHTGEFHRVSGVTHQQLRMELGLHSAEEMNRLLESASVGFDSGYWQFARAITPVLSHENYLKVKSLLVERLARRSEF